MSQSTTWQDDAVHLPKVVIHVGIESLLAAQHLLRAGSFLWFLKARWAVLVNHRQAVRLRKIRHYTLSAVYQGTDN